MNTTKLGRNLSDRVLKIGTLDANNQNRTGQPNKPSQPTHAALRRRTLFAVGTVLTSLIGVVYVTASTILMQGYARLEARSVQQNIERLQEAYQKNLEDLSVANLLWSAWDDTYYYVEHPNPDFIETNVSADIFLKPGISCFVIVNNAGTIVYGEGLDQQKQQREPLPSSLEAYLQNHPDLLHHATPESKYSGIIMLPEAPMLITSHPILTSQMKGPPHGAVIVGRYLNDAVIQQLAQTTRLSLSLYRINDRNHPLSPDLQAIVQQLSNQSPAIVQPRSEILVSGYTTINDIQGKPALLMQIDVPREVYQQGQSSLHYLAISLVILGLVFGGTTQLLLERIIQFWYRQQASEARYRAVIAQASEGIFLIDAETKQFLEANRACLKLLGYSEEELLKCTYYDVVADTAEAIDRDIQHTSSGLHHFAGEQLYRCQGGTFIDVEVNANLIHYSGRDTLCIVVRDITERKRSEAALRESERQLAWQASHDSLTGLVNRREFERQLEQVFNEAQLDHTSHALCYLDLDQFKIINDTCGHGAGDELLCQVTTLLHAQVRSTDVLGRLGGDEFGLLLRNCALGQALRVANELRQSLQEFRFIWQDKIFAIGVSIGVVAINFESQDLAKTLSAADAACYVAKNRGRNRVHLYHLEDSALVQQRGEMQWATRIRRALEEDRFCLYYQPMIATALLAPPVEHYEILLRLRDETGTLVPPNVFIPAAERYNLMHLVDRWVIQTLFMTQGDRYRQAWNQSQQTQKSFLCAINLSGASINDDEFVEFLHKQFDIHQVPPQVICFEITETVAISNLGKATQFIRTFKELGCHFALDDFGSGMSSFAYLKNLPIDYLKISGEFVKDILENPTHLAMITAINQVGHVMKLKTIAEFVETQAVLDKLCEIGVDYAQGYGIAKPRLLEEAAMRG